MSRITIPTLEDAPEGSRSTLDVIRKQLGVVPNLFRLVGVCPAALAAYTAFRSALTKSLDVKTRERIALAVAQVNGCEYCLSAHTYIGLNLAKLDHEEIKLNRQGASTDTKANAAVAFARSIAAKRGHVDASEIATVRAAGFTDAQIVEIVAHVAENVFTNFVNEVAKTDIDFPIVRADEMTKAA